MTDKDDLIRRLCESLAFHLCETELTISQMIPVEPEYPAAVHAAKALIEEAGYSYDELYPPEDRPTVHLPH